MNLMKGLIAGLIAGIVGAVVWAAIAFYGKVEIGYLAWGIGALVGFAFAFGGKGGGAASAAMAVLITILSICGGKYLGATWAIDAELAEFDQAWTDEYCISYLADEIIETKQANGEQVNLKEPEDQFRDSEDEYPSDIWAAAKSKWGAMDQTAQKEFIDGKKTEQSGMQGEFRKAFAWEAFKGSFGPIDIIFFVLGVVTAWQIAFMDPVKAETE